MKLLILLLVVALGAFIYFKPTFSPTNPEPSPTPLPTNSPEFVERNDLAGFGIYTHGTFRVFTNPRYHNKSEDIYITKDNPYVINIKKPGATWGDFFKTLPMNLTSDCLTAGTGEKFCNGEKGTLKFYVNGERVDNFLERKIEDGDRALISFGKEADEQIEKQMEAVVNPLP